MYLWKCKSKLYLKNPFINFAFKSVNMMHANLNVKRENFNFETKYALIAYIWEKIWKKKMKWAPSNLCKYNVSCKTITLNFETKIPLDLFRLGHEKIIAIFEFIHFKFFEM